MKWRLGLDVGTNSMGWAALEIADGIDDRGKALGKPVQLIDSGVRIFSDGRDPQSKESLAASRREPRGARRNRDRYIKRRTEFMDRLIEHGLMPSDKTKREELEKQDPWALRVHGLDEQLTLHQLGRALFHLQQRRGFKSNRKTDKGSDEKGAIKQAELQVKERMKEQGARTLGELLGRERVDQEKRNQTLPKGQRKPLTVARAKPTKVKNKNTYDFYPTRDMVAHEFDALWNQQKQYHRATLNDVAYDALANQDTSTGKQVGSLFFQRPLKPQPVGKCALYPHEEERAPKALTSTQALRIYQEVNHLKLRQPGLAERKLTVEERSKIVANLLSSQKVSFDRIRKTLLKLPDASFSIESPKVKDLKGDLTAYILCQKPSAKVTGRWGPKWRDMPRDQQDAIVEILLGMDPVYGNDRENPAFAPAVQSIANALGIDEAKAKELLATNDEQNVINWLVEDFGFSRERAEAIESAPIPAGHGRLGRTATNKISPWLMSEQAEAIDPINNETRIFAPYTYDQSCRLGGYSHTPTPDGEVFDQLPYYGKVLERSVAFGTGDVDHKQEKRIGKIANPTVHVALNQIRAVVNALAKRYGTPQEIVVEVARDLPLSAKGKKDLDKQQTANKKANDARVAELTEHGQRNTYDNRMRMRLWEELNQNDKLNRCCVYTGEQIGIERLFSAEVEIEHILPRSRTLDDGFGNKTLSMKTANRYKGQRTPSEAFGDSKDGYDWAAISARADNLSDNKKWRFGPDAMERFDEKERGFLARQLGDTRYIARLTREYLTKMAGPYNVWVTTGHLTSELRHAWGLNSVLAGHNRTETEAEDIKKNRNDHRHHALDAVVIAMIDRSLLQRVATAAGKAEERLDKNWFKEWPDPVGWQGEFRDDVQASMNKIIVSHKADHGVEGELHEGTNYGPITDPISGETRLAYRKELTGLTEAEMGRIGDHRIRRELEQLLYELDMRLAEESEAGEPKKDRKKEIAAMLGEYSQETGTRRVRLHKVQADYEIIKHNGHQKAVIPGENYCVDLVETSDGKWRGVGVTRFAANRQKRLRVETPLWKQQYPDARHIMRVRKGDLLLLEKDGREQVMRVWDLRPSANLSKMAQHNETGDLQKRHDNKDDSFRWDFAGFTKMKARKARLVHVDPSGKLYDPGPPS